MYSNILLYIGNKFDLKYWVKIIFSAQENKVCILFLAYIY